MISGTRLGRNLIEVATLHECTLLYITVPVQTLCEVTNRLSQYNQQPRLNLKTPPKEFVTWCRAAQERPLNHFVLNKYMRDPANTAEKFAAEINQALKTGSKLGINLNDERGRENIVFRQEQVNYDQDIALLEISAYTGSLTFEQLSIGHCLISAAHREFVIILRNCVIRRLEIHGCKSVTLVNCQVGTLGLNNASLQHFDMRGGCILDIECHPPWEKSPFTGSVSIIDVFLPRDPEKYLIKTPQPYRNLRAHLRRLENSQGSNLIHSAELAIERVTDNRTNKLLSHLYEQFSDFGSSALRPLVWLSLLWLVSFIVIFISDGAALAFAKEDYTGWRSLLTCTDTAGQVSRAAVLSLQQLASPLTILGAKPLLIPEYLWLAVWSVIHSLLSVVLLALFVLAVRRRFKMQ